MFITAQNIVPYLMERGTIDSARVVHQNCRVENSSSRNRCFRIVFDTPPGVFVKQAPIHETGVQTYLQIEAECLKLFQESPLKELVGPHAPRLYSFDQTRGILAVDLIADTLNARAYVQQHPEQRQWTAKRIGQTLAKFHLPVVSSGLPRLPMTAQHRVPGILRDSSALLQNRETSIIGEKLRQFPEFFELLNRLAELWQSDGLMHGDVRWDNLLFSNSDPEQLWVIDWELAGGGDTAWDVAGVVQAFLIDWVAEQITLEQLQEHTAIFLESYLLVRTLPNASEFISKTIRYAGGRLVQSTLEHHPAGAELGHLGRQMLQLSWNTLRDPQSVMDELLRLDSVQKSHA